MRTVRALAGALLLLPDAPDEDTVPMPEVNACDDADAADDDDDEADEADETEDDALLAGGPDTALLGGPDSTDAEVPDVP